MPKRKSVKTIKSDEVQGEGSYIRIVQLKVRKIREMRERVEAEKMDMFEVGLELVEDQVLEWNWVGDDGEPLPQVKDSPEVLNELTEEEATFIVNQLIGADEAKN